MPNRFILSAEDFKESVRDNLFSMELDTIFCVDVNYVTRTYDYWVANNMPDDYRYYVTMLLTLPDNIKYLDTNQIIFKLARKIGNDIVVQLAESFYYDDNKTVIGEKLISQPLDNRRDITDEEVLYFLDIVDTIYNRTNVDIFTEGNQERKVGTLDMVRQAFVDENYLNIFRRE